MERPREKRYGWHRRYNGFPFDPKWVAVSDHTKIGLSSVIAVVDCLLDAANTGRPRGSVADFSARDCAAGLRLPIGVVVKVYRCLERFGWIDGKCLANWNEWQPSSDNVTPRPAISQTIRDQIFDRDGHTCVYCGSADGPFHLDHIKPFSRGGPSTPENLCVACAPCNFAKRDRTPEEWTQ
jgi:hypothetical protein